MVLAPLPSTDILSACRAGRPGIICSRHAPRDRPVRLPVKSCRGLAVESALVDARGFAGDRRYMVVDAQGQFLTQRVHPRMALIETALTAENLTLSYPSRGSVSVSLSGFRSPVSGIDSRSPPPPLRFTVFPSGKTR